MSRNNPNPYNYYGLPVFYCFEDRKDGHLTIVFSLRDTKTNGEFGKIVAEKPIRVPKTMRNCSDEEIINKLVSKFFQKAFPSPSIADTAEQKDTPDLRIRFSSSLPLAVLWTIDRKAMKNYSLGKRNSRGV